MIFATADGGLYDEAALITATATAVGTVWLLFRQQRHGTKLDQVTDTLNHTAIAVDADGDDSPTLGQRIVGIERKIGDLTVTNTREHELILESLHLASRRIDVLRADLDELRKEPPDAQ